MQSKINSKSVAHTTRQQILPAPARAPRSAPQPLDDKLLRQVAGGTTALPNKTW